MEDRRGEGRAIARAGTVLVWVLFTLLALAALLRLGAPVLDVGPFRLDALALFLGAGVTLVSGTVHVFAARFMLGEAGYAAFFARLTGLTLVVLLLLAADHMALFLAAWVAMGWLLADLIGHVCAWPQARAAAALARRWFLGGAAALAAGLLSIGLATGQATISGAIAAAGEAGMPALWLGALGLGLAAAIQSGLFPFHRWLMSSMTAPTPVSAFMHAGLVNAGGVLIARFAPVLEATPGALQALFLLGAAAALFGALAALVQTDVKRALAASTAAQMGFMVLQCGLGLAAAAMAHLMLHGLTKASLFLGAGGALSAARRPIAGAEMPDARALGSALAAALLAGGAFALVTGKLDGGVGGAGLVLVLFAAATAAQAAIALRPRGLRAAFVVLPGVLGLAGGLYGAVVLAVEALVAPTPGLVAPVALGPLHAAVLVAFLIAWGVVLAGAHRRSAALYARLLAGSQPGPATITDRREAYRHA